MAIDTNEKKLSLMELLQPWQPSIPIPTGDLDQGDLQHVIYEYSGLLSSPVLPSITDARFFRRPRRR